jgi:DNA-binding NtrC family response regulator
MAGVRGGSTLEELRQRVAIAGIPFPIGVAVWIASGVARAVADRPPRSLSASTIVVTTSGASMVDAPEAGSPPDARTVARLLWETIADRPLPDRTPVPPLAAVRAGVPGALDALIASSLEGDVGPGALAEALAALARELPGTDPVDVALLLAGFASPAEPETALEAEAGATRPAARSGPAVFVSGGLLEGVSGPAAGRSLEVSTERALVGRAEGCDLVVPDPLVSAAHLELLPTASGVVARDLGTTNGTFLGTVRVREVVLSDGTELALGGSVVRFRSARAPARVPRAERSGFHGLVGGSTAMQALYASLGRLSAARISVLLEGETGTGKERVARAIHDASDRRDGPFVVVDCGALPSTLVESTLFGHEKGAFSGADSRSIGLIEGAGGGTILLDEIGELPLEMQTRLLRVVESRTVRRVGGSREIPVEVRFLSATHRDLPAMVASGAFRADLFFRLAAARVVVPPLRERLADVPALADAVLAEVAGPDASLSPDALEALCRRDFPGNVRELRNVIEAAAAFAGGGAIRAEHLTRQAAAPRLAPVVQAALPPGDGVGLGLYREAKEAALAAFDRVYLARLLDEAGGNLTRAAARAGLERHHLRTLLKKRGLWNKGS